MYYRHFIGHKTVSQSNNTYTIVRVGFSSGSDHYYQSYCPHFTRKGTIYGKGETLFVMSSIILAWTVTVTIDYNYYTLHVCVHVPQCHIYSLICLMNT